MLHLLHYAAMCDSSLMLAKKLTEMRRKEVK